MEFPDDFVSAIGDIQTDGGVTVEALSVTENGTYTAPTGKAYSPVTVNVSGGGTDELLLLEQNQLTSRTSTATSIKEYTYRGATNLQTMNIPYATDVGVYAFHGCSNLTAVNVPKLTSFGVFCFYKCTQLVSLDFPVLGSIPQNAFAESNRFTTLILRKSDRICTLAHKNAFTGTPFASSGTGGTLYVPQDLIASYQSANNWSTILGYPNNQIKAIEGSEYE